MVGHEADAGPSIVPAILPSFLIDITGGGSSRHRVAANAAATYHPMVHIIRWCAALLALAAKIWIHERCANEARRASADPVLEVQERRAEAEDSAAPKEDLVGTIDFAFQFEQDGVRIEPVQVRSEFIRFSELARDLRPERVQIGNFNGGTFFVLAAVASDDAVLVSLDRTNGAGRRALLRGMAYGPEGGPAARLFG